jgi:hypothetical protein
VQELSKSAHPSWCLLENAGKNPELLVLESCVEGLWSGRGKSGDVTGQNGWYATFRCNGQGASEGSPQGEEQAGCVDSRTCQASASHYMPGALKDQ